MLKEGEEGDDRSIESTNGVRYRNLHIIICALYLLSTPYHLNASSFNLAPNFTYKWIEIVVFPLFLAIDAGNDEEGEDDMPNDIKRVKWVFLKGGNEACTAHLLDWFVVPKLIHIMLLFILYNWFCNNKAFHVNMEGAFSKIIRVLFITQNSETFGALNHKVSWGFTSFGWVHKGLMRHWQPLSFWTKWKETHKRGKIPRAPLPLWSPLPSTHTPATSRNSSSSQLTPLLPLVTTEAYTVIRYCLLRPISL